MLWGKIAQDRLKLIAEDILLDSRVVSELIGDVLTWYLWRDSTSCRFVYILCGFQESI